MKRERLYGGVALGVECAFPAPPPAPALARLWAQVRALALRIRRRVARRAR